MIAAPLDPGKQRRHKQRNLLQSMLLLAAMIVLVGLCGFVIAGVEGVLWALIAGALSLLLSPRISPRIILRLQGARLLRPRDAPELVRIMGELARRAGWRTVPELWLVPSPAMNAFAIGRPDDAAMAVTAGLLERLTLREVAAVLAHEISHIRNNDLWIMGLAETISRLTSTISFFGLMLLVLSLPAMAVGMAPPPFGVTLLLIGAPSLVALLQLALSRAREFEADLDAAGLTGDPAGLASALAKLERFQGRLWERVVLPGRQSPVPSLFRTHPPTEERIRRLLALESAPSAITSSAMPWPTALAGPEWRLARQSRFWP